jgi:hypothetical protein
MGCVNKRGSSHLEIIISFVLFVGFSVFLMTYLQPTQQTSLQDSILFGLKNKFFDGITTNVSIAFVKKGDNSTQWPTCSILPVCKPKEVAGSYWVGELITGTCFYRVYVSNEFSLSGGTDSCFTSNYTIGFVEVQIVSSNRSLYAVNQKYFSNYDGLKQDLGVPVSVDFSIETRGLETYSMTKQIPDDADVVAGLYRQPVLYANGTIVNQDFTIKIW